MALLKYLNRVNGSTGTPLPNPESFLNEVVDRKAIEAANEEVMKVCSKGPKGVKHRLPYLKGSTKTECSSRQVCSRKWSYEFNQTFSKGFSSRCIEGKYSQWLER